MVTTARPFVEVDTGIHKIFLSKAAGRRFTKIYKKDEKYNDNKI